MSSNMAVTKKLNDNKDEIIEMRLKGFQCKDIGEKFGINPNSIRSFLQRNEIRKRGLMCEENIQKMIDMYESGIPLHKIGEELHFSAETVREKLIERGIHIKTQSECNRKYSINEHYFDEIDTANKAYLLGLLYADGCRAKDSNGILIALQERDCGILEKFKKELETEQPLYFRDYTEDQSRQNQYVLCIHNKRIAESLYKYGVIPNKEFQVEYPDFLEKELVSHFIRGYVDGDGSISHNPKEKRMSMTGTSMLLEGIKNYIETELGVHCTIYIPHRKKNKQNVTRTLSIAGGLQVKKVLDHIYKDAELYIERKHQYYQNMYCA